MKNSTSRMIVSFVLLALVTVWPALAQSGTALAKAQIPFSFVVGQKTLLAGEYEIRPGSKINKDVLWIKNVNSSATACMITFGQSAKRHQGGSYLLFNRYGSQHFLSQVWTEFDQVGRQAPKSATEKELTKVGNPKMAGPQEEVVLLQIK